MTPERAVLEQTPPLTFDAVGVTAHGAADMVDDTEACAPDARGMVNFVSRALGEFAALPHPVPPVRVTAVPAADVNRHRHFGLDIEMHWASVECGRVDGRTGGDVGAGPVVDLHPRPA